MNPLLTRRNVCKLLATVPALGSLGHLQACAAERFQFRWMLASSLYGTLPLDQILGEVAKTGASQIDLWPKRHADQREQVEAMGHDRFANLLQQQHVGLGMTTRYDLGPFGLQDEIKFLKQFGGRLIVTGAVGPRDLSGPECRQAVARFVEQLKPHVAAAEQHGITIAIENHAHSLISTLDSIRYLAELARSPGLGIALAPYHLPQDVRVLSRLIEDLGPKLVHFYAWQHGEGCTKPMPKPLELKQMPGRGPLDFRPLAAALAKIGYAGWTEIFMHPTPRGIPILPTLAEVTAEVNRARQYLNNLS
jgi:sugar phosphate isomerase/epimerase